MANSREGTKDKTPKLDPVVLWQRFVDEHEKGAAPGTVSLADDGYAVDLFAEDSSNATMQETLQPSLPFLFYAIRSALSTKVIDRFVEAEGRLRDDGPKSYSWKAPYFDEKFDKHEALATHFVQKGDREIVRASTMLKKRSGNSKRHEIALLLADNGKVVVCGAYCAVVNAWTSDMLDLQVAWEPKDLFDPEGLAGRDSIDKFLTRLVNPVSAKGGPGGPIAGDKIKWLLKPETLSDEPLEFVHAPDDERALLLERAEQALFRPDSNIRIFNVHSRRMRGGLTAFATAMLTREDLVVKRSRPALYVPLHGRQEEKIGERFDDLLDKIAGFYSDLVNTPVPKGDRSTVIDFVREAMARSPAILVFDGLRISAYGSGDAPRPLHALLSAVAEDGMLNLLERLFAEPTPAGKRFEKFDRDTFLQNRCLVLSDRELFRDGKDHYRHKFLKLVDGQSGELPEPAPDAIPSMIDTFGNQSPSQIANIVRLFGSFGVPERTWGREEQHWHSQQLLAHVRTGLIGTPVSESVYGVLSTLKCIEDPIKLPLMKTPDDEEELLSQLFELLVPALSKPDSLWLLFLYLIAIAPGGLRPKTLCRVTEYYLEMVLPEAERPTREEIYREVGEFLIGCNGIVGLCRVDEQYAIPHRRLPLVWRNTYSLKEDENEHNRAIMFAFEEARELFIDQALKKKKGGEFLGARASTGKSFVALLHALLSEEAYAQYVQAARYDTRQAEGALDRHHRLIIAIYHGAASLMDHKLARQLKVKEGAFFLPCDPVRRWVTIYALLYRTQLDRFPDMELVNRYDVAELKQDILELLARPQLWRGDTAKNWGQLKLVPEARYSRVRDTFYNDLRRSDHSVNRHSPLDWQSLGLHWIRPTRAAKVEKRAHNLFFQMQVEGLSEVESNDGSQAEAIFADLLKLIGPDDPVVACPTREAIEQLETRVSDFVYARAEIVEADFKAVARPWAEAVTAEAAAAGDNGWQKVKRLIGRMALLAEAFGWDAERLFAEAQDAGKPPANQGRVRNAFSRSFATFYLCEFLRQEALWTYPVSNVFVISGSVGRAYIRVCLKLARSRQDTAEFGDLFWRLAQNTSDELSRYRSRYPRERAAILILDAAIARYAASACGEAEHEKRKNILDMALECLAQAEKEILSLGMHNRLRLRFSLERCKVLLARAKAEDSTSSFVRLCLAMARSDANLIGRLAGQRGYWQKLAKVQLQKLKEQDPN